MIKNTEHSHIQAYDDDMISLSELIAILVEGRKWVIGSIAAFMAVACFYLLWVDPVYKVSAEIDYNQEKIIHLLAGAGDEFSDAKARSDIKRIYSRDFLNVAFNVAFNENERELAVAIINNVSVKEINKGIYELSMLSKNPEKDGKKT